MKDSINVALCQLKTVSDKGINIKRAEEMLIEAAVHGADMAILPEMFNTPFDVGAFGGYVESEMGPTCQMLATVAKDYGMVVVGGSIPERDETRLYNTSFVYGPKGKRLAKYRKRHLFDVDIPQEISFQESRILSAGDEAVTFQAFGHTFGLAICFDVRFPEFIHELRQKKAEMIVIPASFNRTTGPAHWELLARARAVDNQAYLAMVATSPDPDATYVSYGHSLLVDPWGEVVTKAGIEEEVLIEKIDFKRVADLRQEMPLEKIRQKG